MDENHGGEDEVSKTRAQEINSDLVEIVRRVNEITDPIREFQRRIHVSVERFSSSPHLLEVQNFLHQLPDVVQNLSRIRVEAADNFETLSKNGWFVDLVTTGLKECLDIASDYCQLLEIEGHQKADSFMADHFETAMHEGIDELSEEVSKSRLKLIDNALEAHFSGNYALSTPMFIIQADGHHHETKEQGYWGNKRATKSLLSDLRNKTETATYAFAAVEKMIARYNPLIANDDDRKKNGYEPHIVNRHLVLHGIDTEYATRENSCRAFAFMLFSILIIDDMLIEVANDNSD